MRKSRQILMTILITIALVGLAIAAGTGRKEKTVHVLAARTDIIAGSQITSEQLVWIDIPESLQTGSYAAQIEDVSGSWAASQIDAGELISLSRLRTSASGIIYPASGPGRRLITLDIKAADANGFWLSAGSLIDLYLIPHSRENGTQTQVLERVRIMSILPAAGVTSTGGTLPAVGAAGSAAKTAGGLICLDVNSEQAYLIINARGQYDICLSAINEPEKEPD